MVLSTLAPVLLLLAPAPARVCPDTPPAQLGPAGAPTEVDVYIDPAQGDDALLTVLDLQRLVAEHEGRLRVDLHVVRGPSGGSDPRAEEIRAWLVSVARRGRLVPALRLLARDGFERVHARLSDPGGFAALARAIELSERELRESLDDPCAPGRLRTDSRRLFEAFRAAGSTVFRLPVFTFGTTVSEDLDRLRAELARAPLEQTRARREGPVQPPAARPSSVRLRRPRLGGALLGGPGLPHRFVVMGRDEDDPSLIMLLPPVLEYRQRHPGELAIHVVARGISVGGMRLRHRLCAARRLGRVPEYIAYLARDPNARRTLTSAQSALLEELDAVPEERCEDQVDPAELGLPDGGWLDGIPRTRSELDDLGTTLDQLEAAHRPLSPLLSPPQSSAREED